MTHSHTHDSPHTHENDHNHEHNHIPKDRKIIAISFIIITAFMLVEFWGGHKFNSLALSADAGHMANDSLSLFLALIALFLSSSKQKWFALLNGMSLVIVAIIILIEAFKRWSSPLEIQAIPMLGIAILGLIVNLIVAWIMLKSEQENLNVKSAYLHVLADLFGSVIAIISGLSVYFFNLLWVDTIASCLLSLFILKSGIGICKEAILSIQKNT